MAPTIGVNLRVTGHCNQGGRKYMEDAFVVAYQQTEDEKDLEYAYFGIFDGHGGREAALFAKEHLMDHIVDQKNFWSDDDELVLKAIRDGFITTHMAMWKEVGKWPKTVSGLPSTSGTTSSVAFIRRGKMYIGHVGDSKIVVGYQDPGSKEWLPLSLTKDHKPESPKEKKRIYSVGGLVMNKAGVERVVWNRPRLGHKGPIRRSTHFDQIPFLAVARSLGDLWSYNYLRREFVVSPEPDVSVFPLDPKRDRCVILASDGLWNMVSTRDAVRLVQMTEEENELLILEGGGPNGVGKPANNPSKRLVDRALSLWYELRMRADNTSVVTVLLDPPGPPKSEVLLRQKIMQKLRPREDQIETEIQSVQSDGDGDCTDSRWMKKSSSEIGSNKVVEEPSLATKEKKKLSSPESRCGSLPKPVVLSPQRVVLKRTLPRNDSKTPVHPSSCNSTEGLNRPQSVLRSSTSNRAPLSVRTKPFYQTPEVKESPATCSTESVINENTTPLTSCLNMEDNEPSCRKESPSFLKRIVVTVVEGDKCSKNSVEGFVDSNLLKEGSTNSSSLDVLHTSSEENHGEDEECSEPAISVGENRTVGKSDILKKLLLDEKSVAGSKRKHPNDGASSDTSPLKSSRIQQIISVSTGQQFSSCRSAASQDSNLPHNTRAQQRVRKMKV